MPQTKQAHKALRQSKRKEQRNKLIKSEVKTLMKKTKKAVDNKDKKSADMIKEAVKKIDKATQKGLIKKNTAARKKSRLMKAFNKTQKTK